MKKIPFWMIGVGLILIIGMWAVGNYNGLIAAKGTVDQSWADVTVQLQRRFDLLPNVIASVKGQANFEQETLTGIVEARNSWAKAQQSGDINEQVAAANMSQSALSRLLVTVEAYPTLQANQAFTELRVELSGAENRIAVARKDFNQAATTYNVRVKRFPAMIFAGLFGFDTVSLYEASAGSEIVPTVNFE
jgi:LemA protein